jgi:hypothetical protein
MRLHFTNDWLRRKIASDADVETEAGMTDENAFSSFRATMNDHTNWQHGRFVDGPKYRHMSDVWKQEQRNRESLLVRPAPLADAICIAATPDDAIWIAKRLNLAASYSTTINPKNEVIEHAGYLATAAEDYLKVMGSANANVDELIDSRRTLASAVHEFRKRLARLGGAT